jgi:Xaa-Arg dipeptidase
MIVPLRYAHKVLTEFVEARGFSVTRHYLGLETAWRADWSNVSPWKKSVRTIGFNSEMDALPAIGHACGHNLIAIGGVAAALGTKYAMEKCGIEGRVVLLGTPGSRGFTLRCNSANSRIGVSPLWFCAAAEESGHGKILLLKEGAYKEMDACLMCIRNLFLEEWMHGAHESGDYDF